MRRRMVGALIGFAVGVYVASFLLTNVFSELNYNTPLYKVVLIFVNSIIITGFCFFGIHIMSDIHGSIEEK